MNAILALRQEALYQDIELHQWLSPRASPLWATASASRPGMSYQADGMCQPEARRTAAFGQYRLGRRQKLDTRQPFGWWILDTQGSLPHPSGPRCCKLRGSRSMAIIHWNVRVDWSIRALARVSEAKSCEVIRCAACGALPDNESSLKQAQLAR